MYIYSYLISIFKEPLISNRPIAVRFESKLGFDFRPRPRQFASYCGRKGQ